MSDIWHVITKWIDHNRYTAVGLIAAFSVFAWVVGCESTTAGLSGQLVNRQQFNAEIADAKADIEREMTLLHQRASSLAEREIMAKDDLDEQDEKRQEVIDTISGLGTSLASGGTFTGAQIITTTLSMAGIIGGGNFVDTRRKNKIISELKSNGSFVT